MTGAEFENVFAKWLFDKGFWALNIPKNKFGAQPFDIIAIKDDFIWAIDCKVCGQNRLDLRRVEPNQLSAFNALRTRTNAHCSFVCWHKNVMYEITFNEVEKGLSKGAASIKLERMIK